MRKNGCRCEKDENWQHSGSDNPTIRQFFRQMWPLATTPIVRISDSQEYEFSMRLRGTREFGEIASAGCQRSGSDQTQPGYSFHFSRGSRESSLFAVASSTNTSFVGFHFNFRPRR